MWNWKPVYEDEEYALFCDLDQIVDTVGDGEGMFGSTECYMPIPERFGVWTTLFLKTGQIRKDYLENRKAGRLSTTGYNRYRYTLCLVEFDSSAHKYRAIPAADYNSNDEQIGDSSLLDGNPPVAGLSDDWASLKSKNAPPMIRALFKIFNQQ